ncbi:MAG: MFS transporter [Candidatus Tumulicola sp.]
MTEFQKLWAGQTVSLLGSALTNFALPTLAVLVLHASALQVGAIAALQMLPFPVLGMFVGVLADRFSRRRMMLVSDWIRFVVLASIPIAAFSGHLTLPLVYVVALVSGTASVFFGIAYQSYLPVVVATDELTSANAKLEFSNSGSQMAGSALGGVIVQWIGAAAAIGVDAFSYLVSAVSLSLIRKREPAHDGARLTARQGFREIGEGIRFVVGSRDLRWVALTTATVNAGGAIVNAGGAIVNAVILIYAYRMLRLQPGWLGVAFGVAEVGFIGALFATRLRARFGLRRVLIGAILFGSLGGGVYLLGALGLPYVMMAVATAISAITIPIYNINQISYRQALTDIRMQGRVNATMRTFVWGTLPIGSLVGGYLGSVVGATQTIVIGTVLWAASAMWLLPFREREISTDERSTGP